MSELSFRAATRADLPFIVGLIILDDVSGHAPAGIEEAGAPGYAAALDIITADPNQELYIAELAGEPVGSFQLTFIPGIARLGMWRGLVEGVHIGPAFRNRGFGSAMMAFAIERCRARRCGVVQLTSNKKRTDAHRFYRRLGFEQSHEGFKLYL